MKKPGPVLVLSVLVPFLHGCFSLVAEPLPPPPTPPAGDIRGIVVEDDEGERRVQPDPLHDVVWTDSTVALTGVFETGGDGPAVGTVQTRAFPLSRVTGVLVREFDSNTTSIIVAVGIVGSIAVAALLLTGQTGEDTRLPGG